MTLTAAQVRRNGYTDNLNTDHVAVDAQGNVLARADTAEAALQAAPDAVATFTGKDLDAVTAPEVAVAAHASNPAFAAIVAQVDPEVLKDYEPVAAQPQDTEVFTPDPTPAPTEPVKITTTTEGLPAEPTAPAADGSAFDHDGDGRPGGSKPKASRQRKPKSEQ